MSITSRILEPWFAFAEPRRRKRIIRGFCLFVLFLSALLTMCSFAVISYREGSAVFRLDNACLCAGYLPDAWILNPEGLHVRWLDGTDGLDMPMKSPSCLAPEMHWEGWNVFVRFSLWIPLVVASLPLLLWQTPAYKRFQRSRQSACSQCGYNLRGNTSGRCPECGVPL